MNNPIGIYAGNGLVIIQGIATVNVSRGDIIDSDSFIPTHPIYRESALIGLIQQGRYKSGQDFGYFVDNNKAPDWWRCDGCGHAVAFKKSGELQVDCPHCGAQMPTRYD